MTKKLNIFTDGGARGNPGPAAIGVYVEDSYGKKMGGFGRKIGHATNNIAEYQAVIEALLWVIGKREDLTNVESINFFLDSKLVCSQIRGLYKIKNSDLLDRLFKIHELESEIKLPIFYSHIPREKNKNADLYVNQALDSRM